MPIDLTSGSLREGAKCYRNQEFFLAHEHWECVWLKSDEPDKTFLQALIQITAAFHHLQRQNVRGTVSLLRAAHRRLEPFPPDFGGLAVSDIRESISDWLQALDKPGTPQLRFPQI